MNSVESSISEYYDRIQAPSTMFYVRAIVFGPNLIHVDVVDRQSLDDIGAALEVQKNIQLCVDGTRLRRFYTVPADRVILKFEEMITNE